MTLRKVICGGRPRVFRRKLKVDPMTDLLLN